MIDQTTDSRQKSTITHQSASQSNSVSLRLITLLALAFILMACVSTQSPPTAVTIQAALPTPTLEPTFTPRPTSPTVSEATQASLSGRILDQNNVPIADAQVRAGAATGITSADGSYTLTGLEPGQYVLSVTHPNYDPGLSSILTVAAGQTQAVNLALYAPNASPYPQDAMLTNPLDPNGAPIAEDAERLAREQGLTGKVISIAETKLSGEYLVNYKIGDDIRAAVAELNHEAWELTDNTGRTWWIIKVCGNLASPLPQAAPITTPVPRPLLPMAEVVVDGLSVKACASEDCAEVGTVQRGTQIEVFGCLADGSWCEVGLPGGKRGWCTGQSLQQLAVAQAIPIVEAPTPVAQTIVRDDVDWIAYLGPDRNIWLMDPATGEQRQLTYAGEPAFSAGPAWSPDGTKLAISVGGNYHPDGLKTDLAIIDLNTGELRYLGLYEQEGSVRPVAIESPAWSPDGSMIYYSMTLDGLMRSWLLRRIRLEVRKEEIPPVSRDWFWEGYPAFSPDGRWMTYSLTHIRHLIELPDSNWGIWLADANGQNPRQGVVGAIGKSAWSPDSTQIVYDAYFVNTDERGIFVVNIDGSNTRHLTDDGRYPTWSPDGQQIAFVRYVDNNSSAPEIWLMNAGGTNQRKLTDGSQPAWRPARRQ